MEVADTISFESCPDGTAAGSSEADVSVELVKLTNTVSGLEYTTESDFSSFFSNI